MDRWELCPRIAARVRGFFRHGLTHSKGEFAGKPFILEPWEDDLLVTAIATVDKETRLRRYKTIWLEVPRKNGKSTIAAGVALYLLLMDGEAGAEIYGAASDRLQASIVFGQARSMIASNEALASITKTYRTHVLGPRQEVYRVLSADAARQHGLNASGIIFDEVHTQPTRELYDVLHTSTGSRTQPLELLITTAGFDKNSICFELHDYALKVLSGAIEDETFLPRIYAAEEGDDWTSPDVWAKANPNLGVSISLDYLKGACKKAQQIPAYQNTFRRLHLNQWTEQENRWIDLALWDSNHEEGCTLEGLELTGAACFGALDLSETKDITAFIAAFPLPDGRIGVVPRIYCPVDRVASRSRDDRVPYDVWLEDGLMVPIPGNIMDYELVCEDIMNFAENHQLTEVAVDRWNSTFVTTKLNGEGIDAIPMGQGFASMSAPTKELERLLLAGKIEHFGNPILRWMAGNMTIAMDPAGNVKPDKAKAREKIDGIVALIMAIDRLMRQEEASIYETRAPIVF